MKHHDPLLSLLDDALRQGSHRKRGNTYFVRENITPPKKPKIPKIKHYSDTERFQWYFHKREGRSIHQWRELIDKEMRDEEAKCPETH